MITGQQIVDQARTYLRIPFRHTGRSRTGLDCVGLIICTMHDLGYSQWDDVNYSRLMPNGYLRNKVLMFCTELTDQPYRLGDILLFSIKGYEQHIGIYTGDNNMIHAYQSVNCVAEHRIDNNWQKRLVTRFRLKDISN